jgi:hypothetical protein
MPIGRCFWDYHYYTINLATCVTKLLWTNRKWRKEIIQQKLFFF